MLRTIFVPQACPIEGHVRECRVQAVVGANADQIEIMIDQMALKISLIDVAAPKPQIVVTPGHGPVENPAAVDAVAAVYSIVAAARGPIRVWLPPPPGPRSRLRWERTIRPNTMHPGVIFLDEKRTLNRELVRLGFCWLPERIDRDTLRHPDRPRSFAESRYVAPRGAVA